MKKIYGTTNIEIGGVQQIAAGGTGETTAQAALTALGAASVNSPTFTGTVTIPNLTVTGSITASNQIYFDNHLAIKTPTTNLPGVSAVTKIVAVSALPVSQEDSVLYILF